MLEKENPTVETKNKKIPDNPFDHFFQEHPEAVTPKQLNNFLFNLPGGYYRDSGIYNMDKTYKEEATASLKKEEQSDEQITKILQADFSEKRLNQTIREFYEAIDKAVNECSPELFEKIKKLNKKIETSVSQRETNSVADLKEKLDSLALPVYQKLREWGYKHDELIR